MWFPGKQIQSGRAPADDLWFVGYWSVRTVSLSIFSFPPLERLREGVFVYRGRRKLRLVFLLYALRLLSLACSSFVFNRQVSSFMLAALTGKGRKPMQWQFWKATAKDDSGDGVYKARRSTVRKWEGSEIIVSLYGIPCIPFSFLYHF